MLEELGSGTISCFVITNHPKPGVEGLMIMLIGPTMLEFIKVVR
jgi:hypothetical protein